MPNEETAPIPVHATAARPGIRAIAFLAAAGVLLIVSTFTNLVTLPGADAPLATVTGWGLDLNLGHTIQQYIGAVALVCGAALIVVAAASLRPGFAWTRNASLIAGGLGVGAGLFLAAAGYSTGSFLAAIASASGQDIAPQIGIGLWLALLGAACALVAVSSPVRVEALTAIDAPTAEEEPVVYRVDEPEETPSETDPR